jgi:hypothetical protein
MDHLARALDTMARPGRSIETAIGTRLCRGFRTGGYQPKSGGALKQGFVGQCRLNNL